MDLLPCIPRVQFWAWGIFTLLFSWNCCNNAETHDFPVWELPCAEKFKFYPIRTDNIIILPSRHNSNDCIKALNIKNGREIWSVTDSSFTSIYYNFTPYIYDDLLLIPINKNLWCINVITGEIVWKESKNFIGENHVHGICNKAYRSYKDTLFNQSKIYEFDIQNGNSKVIASIPVDNIATSVVRTPMPTFVKKDTYLITGVVDYIPLTSTNSYFSFWNKKTPSQKKIHPAYPNNTIGKGPTHSPVIEGKFSFWIVDRHAVCFDLIEKKECWRTILPHTLLTSRLAKYDNMLYAACEDENIYAIDPVNGDLLWKTKTAGTPSRISFTKESLYLIGGSDRILYEIHLKNGEILNKYKLKSSDTKFERVSYFSNDLALVSDSEYWYSLDFKYPSEAIKNIEK